MSLHLYEQDLFWIFVDELRQACGLNLLEVAITEVRCRLADDLVLCKYAQCVCNLRGPFEDCPSAMLDVASNYSQNSPSLCQHKPRASMSLQNAGEYRLNQETW